MMSTLYYKVYVDADEEIGGGPYCKVGIVHNHSVTLALCHSVLTDRNEY